MSTCRYEHETTITGLKESILALEFSPDGKLLASGCEDGNIRVFSTCDWKLLYTFADVSPSTSLTWHPRIEGLLFCGFKSGDVDAIQTNSPLVRRGSTAVNRSRAQVCLQANVRLWVDDNRDPVHCLSHDPGLDVLAVGSGRGVTLASYRTQGKHVTACYNTDHLPSPPKFAQLRTAKFSEPVAQSIHFPPGEDSIIVSYLHHGVMLVFFGGLFVQ